MDGVEVVVVDAPVEHVDRLGTTDGTHPHLVVAAVEVTALDEFHAHPAGEEGVLEVRRVVDTGCENGDLRIRHSGRCRGEQGVHEPFRVFGDGLHPLVAEQFGEHVRERPSVLQHVGHTRRAPQVVLENGEHTLLVADEVDAGDVDAHSVGRFDPPGRPVEVTGTGDEAARHDLVVEHTLGTVDVGQEHLEGADPLSHPLFDDPPFGGTQQARHEVQRERPFLAGQAERDALPVEVGVDETPAFGEPLLAEPDEDRLQCLDRVDVREVAIHLLIGRKDRIDSGHGLILPPVSRVSAVHCLSVTARKHTPVPAVRDQHLR